jgi:putative endonuclease
MAAHNDLGKKGEDLAVEYLTNKAHRIIARNYRYEKAEVDIISALGNTIVFTEVKARSTDRFGYPEMQVSEKKKQLLRDAMEFYLMENKIKEEARFDIISIVINDKGVEVFHIEDAFYH